MIEYFGMGMVLTFDEAISAVKKGILSNGIGRTDLSVWAKRSYRSYCTTNIVICKVTFAKMYHKCRRCIAEIAKNRNASKCHSIA